MNLSRQGLVLSGVGAGAIMWTSAAALFVGLPALALGLAFVSGACFGIALRDYQAATAVFEGWGE